MIAAGYWQSSAVYLARHATINLHSLCTSTTDRMEIGFFSWVQNCHCVFIAFKLNRQFNVHGDRSPFPTEGHLPCIHWAVSACLSGITDILCGCQCGSESHCDFALGSWMRIYVAFQWKISDLVVTLTKAMQVLSLFHKLYFSLRRCKLFPACWTILSVFILMQSFLICTFIHCWMIRSVPSLERLHSVWMWLVQSEMLSFV